MIASLQQQICVLAACDSKSECSQMFLVCEEYLCFTRKQCIKKKKGKTTVT